MKNPFPTLRLIIAGVAVTSLLCVPAVTRADPVAFTVDSTQSFITSSGSAFGLAFAPQAAGAVTAFYGGTLFADYNPGSGVFTFSGGAGTMISGINNPVGPFSVSPYPAGPLPGQYGVTAGPTFVVGYGFVLVNGVYSGMTLDLTSGTAQNGVAPAGMTDKWTAGTLTYGAGVGASPAGPFTLAGGGPSSMANISGANTSASLVSFNGTTLIIPIAFHTTGSNRFEDWSGQLVFTAVPEPSTLALAGLGFLGLAGLKFSRSRRSH